MKFLIQRFSLNAIAFAATALLAACGGGGDATAPLTSQTISFTPATTGTVGTPITLAATASSSLAVSFTSSPATVCTVSGTTLTLVGAGTCNVKADQAGNTTFAAATQVSKDITVSNAATPMAQAALVVVPGASTLAPSATTGLSTTGGNGTGAVTYSIASGSCSISGTTLTAAASAGTCKISATKAADSSYLVATSSEVTVTISNTPTTPSTTIATFSETGASAIGFGNMDAAVIDEPSLTSNKVLQLVKPVNGEAWAGGTINTCGAGKIGTVPTLPLSSSNKTLSLRVYSPEANVPVRMKLEDASDSTHSVETEATVTAANTWQTLTFDFSREASGTAVLNTTYTFNKASVFPKFGSTVLSPRTFYVDDLKFIGSSSVSLACPDAPVTGTPTTAAATPSATPSNVISIYSDTYTASAGVNLIPGWGQNTITTEITVGGNKVQKYANFNYQGIDFANNPINVSTYSKLHIDLWSSDATSVDVFIINPDKGTGQASEQLQNVPLNASSTWKSVDIQLSGYGEIDRTSIKQIKLVSNPSGKTVYMDNLYFAK